MITDQDTDILTEARYQTYVQQALKHARFVVKNWNRKYWNLLLHQPYLLYVDFYLFNENEYKDIPFKLNLTIEREAGEVEFARFADKVMYNCQRLKVTKFSL